MAAGISGLEVFSERLAVHQIALVIHCSICTMATWIMSFGSGSRKILRPD